MATTIYGILAALDWNSNRWQLPATKEDLDHSNFGFVVDNKFTYTALNFGHELYPQGEQGYYYGLLPQLFTKTPDRDKARYVNIVFLKSRNWEDGQHYLVGFYAFPVFEKGKHVSPLADQQLMFEHNIKALPKDIHQVQNYIHLNTQKELSKFLPKGKQLGTQGFNYLTKENVLNILDVFTKLNPDDQKLHGIKFRILKSLV